MKNIALLKPNKLLFESYKELVLEFQNNQEKLVPFVLAYPLENIDLLLRKFENDSTGVDSNGFVPHTTFWLVDSNSKVLGVSNLRHSLTKDLVKEGGHIGYGIRPSCRNGGLGTRILELSLSEARKLELSSVLLTCNKNNMGSAAIIIKNGGVFESEEYLESYGGVVQRYWIAI